MAVDAVSRVKANVDAANTKEALRWLDKVIQFATSAKRVLGVTEGTVHEAYGDDDDQLPSTRHWPGTLSKNQAAKIDRTDQKIKRDASEETWRGNEDDAFEDAVTELMQFEEFKSIDSFVESKIENDEFSFSAVELQALARRHDSRKLGHEVTAVSPATVSKIKANLIDFGLRFVPREKVKHFRGGMSSSHGSNPFAGQGGGGSGFGFDGTLGGKGPGNVGGGYDWSPDDKKNLPMGAGKKR